jgi:hypothetical protein
VPCAPQNIDGKATIKNKPDLFYESVGGVLAPRQLPDTVQRSLDTDGTFNPPKRNKSCRTVKLTAQAVEALKSRKAVQNEERLRLGSLWEDYDLVFPNRVGNRWTPTTSTIGASSHYSRGQGSPASPSTL